MKAVIGIILGIVLVGVPFLLFLTYFDPLAQAAFELVYVLLGFAILLVAFTTSIVMGVIAWKLYKLPSTASMSDWQPGLTAGSVALFGTLIAGVFVITTFRIDRGFGGQAVRVQEIAEKVAQKELRDSTEAAVQKATRVAAELRVGARVGDIRTGAAFINAKNIDLGKVERLNLRARERVSRKLIVKEKGAYRIEVRAIRDGFDPVVYLYEPTSDDGEWTALDFNDSVSRRELYMERTLNDGKYYIEIEELVGEAGECTILVQRIN